MSDLTEHCAHCGQPFRGLDVSGYATVDGRFVCHPSEGMDCYRLVTVLHHGMPCDQVSSGNPDDGQMSSTELFQLITEVKAGGGGLRTYLDAAEAIEELRREEWRP